MLPRDTISLVLTETLYIPCEAPGKPRGLKQITTCQSTQRQDIQRKLTNQDTTHSQSKYNTCMQESQTTCIGSTKGFVRLVMTAVNKEKGKHAKGDGL